MKNKQTIFLTGASGYIGGSIATYLKEKNYHIKALIRTQEKLKSLESLGFECVLGDLLNLELLKKEARNADIVINAADADNIDVVSAFLEALEGSEKIFIHTSGSSLVGRKENGEKSETIYDESIFFNSNFKPKSEKFHRVYMNEKIMESNKKGIHSVVIIPTMIYGKGSGIKKESIQIPLLTKIAKEKKAAVCIGKGENIWSNVHIEDLVDLYYLALKKAQGGSCFFAENGEASLKEIANKIAKNLNFDKKMISLSIKEAIELWGPEGALFGLGSNSRVRSKKAKEELDWKPRYNSIIDFI